MAHTTFFVDVAALSNYRDGSPNLRTRPLFDLVMVVACHGRIVGLSSFVQSVFTGLAKLTIGDKKTEREIGGQANQTMRECAMCILLCALLTVSQFHPCCRGVMGANLPYLHRPSSQEWLAIRPQLMHKFAQLPVQIE